MREAVVYYGAFCTFVVLALMFVLAIAEVRRRERRL